MAKQAFDKFINKASAAKKKEAHRQEKKALKAEMRADYEARKKEAGKTNEKKYGEVTAAGKRGRTDKAATPESGFKGRSGKSDASEGKFKSRGKAETPEIGFKTRKPDAAGFEAGRKAGGSFEAEKKARQASFEAGKGKRTEGNFSEDKKGRGIGIKPQGGAATRATRPIKATTRTAYGKTDDEKADALQASLQATPRSRSYATTATNKTTAAKTVTAKDSEGNDMMPLNKFIAHAGICGRREAADLVKEGQVVVNGDKIFEPGFKVSAADKIKVKGKPVFLQKNLVYILLNKPKDYITTAKDPEGRKTVLELIKGATQERVYPVGRLDRNTTGVLLLTNDGELAQKLTHPSYEIKKIYEVKLDKPLQKKDYEAIVNGITLEDGFVQADAVGYADPKDKSVIGIQIHSGRNRIVRRIFEHLGYDVRNLDRVMFANLTKKNVDRSKWRLLNEKEVRLLKYMNQSFVRKREKKDA
ncbi:pseudouridine synthase [Filimonas effusa]|uniref:Pseudouridine synthase n=1 Tax=Filimonas effusa TaxID=2508721 RepID=A0A4Q1D451_9BACT|nr:pseudouridine synthase [Filimonas effusa]RXK83205.1 rRNA pseudouridine synthase [Filimonas effusa]